MLGLSLSSTVAKKDAEISELQAEVAFHIRFCNECADRTTKAEEMASRALTDYHALSLRVADFADRSVPPTRIPVTSQPPGVGEADQLAVKRAREGK